MDKSRSETLIPPDGARVTLSDVAKADFTHYETGLSLQGVGYGAYAKAFHEACLRKTAANMEVAFEPGRYHRCKSCLYETRMVGIYLHADGCCNMCHAYADGQKLAAESGRLEQELRECLDADSIPGADCDIVLGLSGGKDSSAVLGYLAQELNLRVVAVLVDNGYIPEFVIDNSRAICERSGAQFILKSFNFENEMQRVMDKPEASVYPCNTCSKSFTKIILNVAVQRGCHRVALGRNYWYRIEPRLTGVKTLTDGNGKAVSFYSLPFLLGWKIEDIWPRLERIGWVKGRENIPGLSTNCTIPGKVEKIYHALTGIHPEAALISNEVICGFLDRAEGMKELETAD